MNQYINELKFAILSIESINEIAILVQELKLFTIGL
jgi:hypothetical protein